ncbi:MAG: hypothetical protein K6T78_00070 [Alicyclobacillus sp.]|nr:hypothetical protein [Alicyclobacillus sp.]
MLRFLLLMVLPVWVCIYTVQFGRWVGSKRNVPGAVAAYAIAGLSFCGSGWILWRLTH